MVIKRKYATYGQLSCDEPSKKAIVKVLEKYNVSEDVYNYILDPYNDIIVINTEMGSGIPGDAYQELRKEFDKLDENVPFDNNLSYSDVDKVTPYCSRKGSAIQLVMTCNKVDLPVRIVQVIAIEHKADDMHFIEPWEIETL